MASFEFYGAETFASCQYEADDFFDVLDDVTADYPLLTRAQNCFKELKDDLFECENGETIALESEVNNLVKELNIDLANPPQKYMLLATVFQELKAVFEESRARKSVIRFRWG